ncbi:MAG: hypothetical protein M3Y86_11720 [Verrucomicrobiota bacterium]|nr:hypothetical protein [Verrucomicrobiota bacterium]
MNEKLPQLTVFLVGALGLLAAVLIGNAIGSNELPFLVEIVAGGALVGWLILAGKYWWLPIAFGIGIGGFFTIPYKLYPHELGLLLSLGALLPQLILRRGGLRQERPAIPKVFYVLGVYLVAHFAFSMIQNQSEGAGNVARAYMNMLWPVVFGFYFWRFGSTKVMRTAVQVMYVAALMRMGFGLVNYFAGTTFVIPAINYTIDPQDLRVSGIIVLVIAVLFATMKGSFLKRVFNGFIALFSVWAILLGGSRSGMLTLIFIPLFIFAVSRKWALVVVSGASAAVIVLWLNVYPGVLNNLPSRAARSASVVVLGERLDVQEDARMSNDWHLLALPGVARERWSRNWRSMAIGTGIRPFRPINFYAGYERNWIFTMAEVSADMGAYESAFWTLLAVLGLIGMGLYFAVIIWLLRSLLPPLMKRKKRDLTWGVMLWASLAIALWVVLIIPAGGYPSMEIFLGLLALATMADEKRAANQRLPVIAPLARPQRTLSLARA